MLRETVGHLRDLPRYRQILATLIRYGYQDIVSAIHLEGIVRPLENLALGEDNIPPADRPQRLRMVCEDLGPTFVKLGQLLSGRPDVLPDPYIRELSLLRDEVRPFPFEEAEAILRADLGDPERLFSWIDPRPLASASISQVHAATLPDGRPVVLKIRRPGIEKVVQADLDILRNLAHLAERRIPWLAAARPVALAKEFERSLKRELDLNAERRTMERCRLQQAGMPFVRVPEAIDALSTGRVLTMERIDGVRVDDLDGIRQMGLDPRDIASRGGNLLARQIFTHGLFHADPHPGNIRVMAGGVIAQLDYGLFGQLDLPTRERIADLLLGLMAQDTDRVMRALNELEISGEGVDYRGLRRDVGEMVLTYSELTLDSIDLTRLLGELVALIRSHHLRLPPDLMLLIRSLITIESVGRHLDPHFDIASHARPYVAELTRKRYSPWRLLSSAGRTAEDVQKVATLLPEVLGQSLESIKRGELRVTFDLNRFEQLVRELTRTGNSLAAGIVIAGLIVGSSLIIAADVGWLALGLAGYSIAVILGAWLLWNMFRGP
ncbi:ABC1 kinase family protein [Tautonia sociabilis]|uniref:AarF/ABC1/UbiB kinase family protein n=1 Tax=Tautonia sociabilis TaxID=2080755 RepID=A0A432MIV4_9BACT|nr:AarF/UbiB family protein [Tautonia sociabilis]RUL87229.1 AarF/ABC1/UbiB kinase family protein [Tautonia sociabilis]